MAELRSLERIENSLAQAVQRRLSLIQSAGGVAPRCDPDGAAKKARASRRTDNAFCSRGREVLRKRQERSGIDPAEVKLEEALGVDLDLVRDVVASELPAARARIVDLSKELDAGERSASD